VVLETAPGWPLSAVVQAWKSWSARKINEKLDRKGAVWHRDYHDRLVRDEEELERAVNYVNLNPVAAGLVAHPSDWRHGSAFRSRPGPEAVAHA
jgi:REP element-mobilizing transposase RayT